MSYAYEIRYDFGPEKIILEMVSIHWQRYTSLMVYKSWTNECIARLFSKCIVILTNRKSIYNQKIIKKTGHVLKSLILDFIIRSRINGLKSCPCHLTIWIWVDFRLFIVTIQFEIVLAFLFICSRVTYINIIE